MLPLISSSAPLQNHFLPPADTQTVPKTESNATHEPRPHRTLSIATIFSSKMTALIHAVKHLWDIMLNALRSLWQRKESTQPTVIEKEISNLKTQSEFASLAEFVSPNLLKTENLFESPMVVLEADWEGAMPFHWITRAEYDKALHFIDLLEQDQIPFHIKMDAPEKRKQIIDTLKILMTRPTSRKCLFALNEKMGLFSLSFVETSPQLNGFLQNNFVALKFSQSIENYILEMKRVKEVEAYVIHLQLNPSLDVCVVNPDGSLSAMDMPFPILVMHELIHVLHRRDGSDLIPPESPCLSAKFLATHPQTRYEEGRYYLPSIDPRYSNWEEMRTIQGLASDSVTENQTRKEFGYPQRVFHCGYAEGICPQEDPIPTENNHLDLLIAFHRGETDHIPEIMQKGDHTPLLQVYFEGIKNLKVEAHHFSQRILEHLTEEDLLEIIRLNGQMKDPLNSAFGEALLTYATSSQLSKTHKMLCLMVVCLSIPSPSKERQAQTAQMIQESLQELTENSSQPFLTDRLANGLFLFFALRQDESVFSSFLEKETLNIYRLRFGRLLSYLGDFAKVFDAQLSSLLYQMERWTLDIDLIGPYFFQSTYLRNKLLEISQDPSFIKGKEAVLANLWKNLLSLETIEAEFINILPMPEEVKAFPAWKEAHREEILQVIQNLEPS